MFQNFRRISTFASNFCLAKSDVTDNTFCLQGFQKLAKLTIFGTFYELLSIQIVNVTRFARNIE